MESRQDRWHDLPTYSDLRRGEEEKARGRAFFVMGAVGAVLRELAEHLGFYLSCGLLGILWNIAVTVFCSGREAAAWAKLAGGIVSAFFAATIMFRAYKSITGERVTVKEAFRGGAAGYFPLLKIFFLLGLANLLAAILRERYGVFIFVNARLPGIVLGGVVLAVCLYFGIVFAVIEPVCVIEHLSVVQSLKRSMRLTKGEWLPVLILMAVCALLGAVPYIAASVLYAPFFRSIAIEMVEIVIAPFGNAFMAVMYVYVYHRLRVAKEQEQGWKNVFFAA